MTDPTRVDPGGPRGAARRRRDGDVLRARHVPSAAIRTWWATRSRTVTPSRSTPTTTAPRRHDPRAGGRRPRTVRSRFSTGWASGRRTGARRGASRPTGPARSRPSTASTRRLDGRHEGLARRPGRRDAGRRPPRPARRRDRARPRRPRAGRARDGCEETVALVAPLVAAARERGLEAGGAAVIRAPPRDTARLDLDAALATSPPAPPSATATRRAPSRPRRRHPRRRRRDAGDGRARTRSPTPRSSRCCARSPPPTPGSRGSSTATSTPSSACACTAPRPARRELAAIADRHLRAGVWGADPVPARASRRASRARAARREDLLLGRRRAAARDRPRGGAAGADRRRRLGRPDRGRHVAWIAPGSAARGCAPPRAIASSSPARRCSRSWARRARSRNSRGSPATRCALPPAGPAPPTGGGDALEQLAARPADRARPARRRPPRGAGAHDSSLWIAAAAPGWTPAPLDRAARRARRLARGRRRRASSSTWPRARAARIRSPRVGARPRPPRPGAVHAPAPPRPAARPPGEAALERRR